MLPPGNTSKNLEGRVKSKTANFVYLAKPAEEIEMLIDEKIIKSEKQIRVLKFLEKNEGIHIVDLEAITDTSRAIIKTLEKKRLFKNFRRKGSKKSICK